MATTMNRQVLMSDTTDQAYARYTDVITSITHVLMT